MGVTADDRPIFDFEGAIEVARTMYAFVTMTEARAARRGTDRDVALAAWSGPYGEDFRQRAADEDVSLDRALDAIRHDAWGWAETWLQMVNNLNRVVYAEARDAQVVYLNHLREREQADDGFGWDDVARVGDGTTDPVAAVGERLAREGYDWLTGDADESFGYVEEPRTIMDLPQSPDFFVAEPPFAWYSRTGHDLTITYHFSPAPEACTY